MCHLRRRISHRTMRSAAASPKSPKCAHGSLTPNHGIRGTDAYLLVWLLQLTLPENTSGVVLRVCKCAMELTGGSQRSKCTRHDRHCLQRAGQRHDSYRTPITHHQADPTDAHSRRRRARVLFWRRAARIVHKCMFAPSWQGGVACRGLSHRHLRLLLLETFL